ncbi:hypothetical protein DIE23_04945 [Burkholderia sp. Bp9143]|nr:hypothetical protein DIE23_04945 [Burkholderia sp. Bp9143]
MARRGIADFPRQMVAILGFLFVILRPTGNGDFRLLIQICVYCTTYAKQHANVHDRRATQSGICRDSIDV